MLKRISPVVAAVALGLVLAVLALAAVLTKRQTHLAGSNTLVEASGVALAVAPGKQRCARENVPEGADRVRIYAGTFDRRPGQPVAVTVSRGGQRVAAGRVPGGYADHAVLEVPLQPRTPEVDGARVCVANLGSRRVRFAGNRTPGGLPAPRVHGEEAIRVDWLMPGRPSWLDVAPEIADRFAASKPTFIGAWGFWAVWALLAALWGATLALVFREARR